MLTRSGRLRHDAIMDDTREARRATLDAVVEAMKQERDVSRTAISALRTECEQVLERCLFDREAALAVLRGEHELDDDPWARCPECDCDTYFRFRLAMERRNEEHTEVSAPLTLFVCEGCQHTVIRARATLDHGQWWTDGTRIRALPAASHPYRDEAALDDDEDEDDADAEHETADAEADDNHDWSQRRVCADGTCVGVVGADARCNVCGTPADPA